MSEQTILSRRIEDVRAIELDTQESGSERERVIARGED